jgi:hypothetical protein
MLNGIFSLHRGMDLELRELHAGVTKSDRPTESNPGSWGG